MFLRKSEVARRLGVTIRTLERWERDGRLPARVQIGPGTVGYRETEVIEFEASRPLASQRGAARLSAK
jgi:predicted DNA-binding transcriptional regulator AlpA